MNACVHNYRNNAQKEKIYNIKNKRTQKSICVVDIINFIVLNYINIGFFYLFLSVALRLLFTGLCRPLYTKPCDLSL